MRKYVLILIMLVLGSAVIGSTCLTFATSSGYTVSIDGDVIYTAGPTRTAACRQMRNMAAVQWTLSNRVSYISTHSGKVTTLSPGSYCGLPYSQLNRSFTDANQLQAVIDSGSIKGTDCSSSVCLAWRTATGHSSPDDNFLKKTSRTTMTTGLYVVRAMLADAMNTGSTSTEKFYVGDYITRVGDYGVYESYCSDAGDTAEVIKWLTASGNYTGTNHIYWKVYAQMKPGDAIITVNDSSAHTCMVLSVDIHTDSSGNILPDSSTVTIIEQRGRYAAGTTTAAGDSMSSWRVTDFSFRTLVEGSKPYIPVRLNSIDG